MLKALLFFNLLYAVDEIHFHFATGISAVAPANILFVLVLLAMRGKEYRRFADPSQRILYAPWQRIDLRRFRPAKKAEYLWYIGTARPVALPDGARILFSTPNSFLARLANSSEPS